MYLPVPDQQQKSLVGIDNADDIVHRMRQNRMDVVILGQILCQCMELLKHCLHAVFRLGGMAFPGLRKKGKTRIQGPYCQRFLTPEWRAFLDAFAVDTDFCFP